MIYSPVASKMSNFPALFGNAFFQFNALDRNNLTVIIFLKLSYKFKTSEVTLRVHVTCF